MLSGIITWYLAGEFCGGHIRRLTTEEEIVTILKDLRDRIDCMQRDQAALRPDIVGQPVGQIVHLLANHWNEEKARRRERCW